MLEETIYQKGVLKEVPQVAQDCKDKAKEYLDKTSKVERMDLKKLNIREAHKL